MVGGGWNQDRIYLIVVVQRHDAFVQAHGHDWISLVQVLVKLLVTTTLLGLVWCDLIEKLVNVEIHSDVNAMLS